MFREDLFKEFLDNKAVINCKTLEQAKALHDLVIYRGHLFTESDVETLWNIRHSDICFSYQDDKAYYGGIELYNRLCIPVILYTDLFKMPKNINKEKILYMFKNSKLAVKCYSQDELDTFRYFCKMNHMVFADSITLNIINTAFCYVHYNENETWMDSAIYCQSKGYTLIDYKDIEGVLNMKQVSYTLTEVLSEIKEGEAYIPVGDNSIIKKIIKTKNNTSFMLSSECSVFVIGDTRRFVKEIKYVSFMEAANSGKKFRYKNWDNFHELDMAVSFMYNNSKETIRKMLNAIAWEIEE